MAPTLRNSTNKLQDTAIEEVPDSDISKLCGVCKVSVPDECAIYCDGICNMWYDINFVKLSNDDYISINDLAENVKWFCGGCDKKLKELLTSNSKTNEIAQLLNTVDILLDAVQGVVSENKKLNEKMDKIMKGRMIESLPVKTVVSEKVTSPWSQIRKGFGRGRGRFSSSVHSSAEDAKQSKIDRTNSNVNDDAVEVQRNDQQEWKTVNYDRHKAYNKGTDDNKPSDPKRKSISESDRNNRARESSVRPNIARSYKEAVIGKRTDSTIKSATKTFMKKKAVFVTRLDPGVKVSDIKGLIDTELNLEFAKCSQLKTNHDGYSSFHVEVHEKDFDLLLSADLWPEGCLVTQFRGFLKKTQFYLLVQRK